VAEGYAKGEIRAATLDSRIALSVSVTLKECSETREDIAALMTNYLGEDEGTVTANMLNAYASQARNTHQISVIRLVALCAVTGDVRPLALLAEHLGFAVVEPRYVHFVKAQMLRDRSKELAALADAEMRAAR
jgi:hypothetical protein